MINPTEEIKITENEIDLEVQSKYQIGSKEFNKRNINLIVLNNKLQILKQWEAKDKRSSSKNRSSR